MPEITPAPTQGGQAALPPKPSGPPPAMTPREALAEVRSQAAGGAGNPAGAPSSGGAAAAPDGGTPPAPDGKGNPPDDAALVKLAKEQRRIDAGKAQLERDRQQLHGAAEDGAKWRGLQEKKSKAGRLAVMQELFGDELEDAYWELNDHVLKTHKEPTPEEKAARAARDATEKRLKEEEDARKKSAEDSRTEEQKQIATNEANFVRGVSEFHRANHDKYPALAATLKKFPNAVSAGDIVTFARTHHGEKGKLPSDEEILQHFEGQAKEATGGAAKPAPTTTVTQGWRSDSPTKPDKELTLKEITEQAKREAGIIK